MQQKNLFRQVLADFRTGKLDILVGTQMIAKGLDFPNVTLVAMINADHSLYMGDFRAAERTFQLLVQVSGRAGRGERAGEVIIQTATPHASPIQFARRNDFDGFLDEEMELRREFNYPPFRHLIRQVIRGKNRDLVSYYAEQWRALLDKEGIPDTDIRGPIPATVEKIHGDYRFQLWFFTPKVISTVNRIQELEMRFQWDRSIQHLLDVDAFNLL
jgi:primosomal protein N' (replication factor Y) (superfamily II helicase)